MSTTFELDASITNEGKIQFLNPEYWKKVLLSLQGQKVSIKIQKAVNDRNEAQRKYYWAGIVEEIRTFHKQTSGEKTSKDDVHYFNIHNIIGLQPKIRTIEGKDTICIDYVDPSEMNTEEFSTFTEQIIKYWSEKGLAISEPIKRNP